MTFNDKAHDAKEQRRHPRTRIGVKFNISLPGEGDGRCRGVISDLSQGGMAFESDALLDEGMTLCMKLPPTLEIRGEVRHVGVPVGGQRRYGVRFHKVGFAPAP